MNAKEAKEISLGILKEKNKEVLENIFSKIKEAAKKGKLEIINPFLLNDGQCRVYERQIPTTKVVGL